VTDFLLNGARQGKTEAFEYRMCGETFVLSFKRPALVVSWAILNGGFRPQIAHIINHHIEANPSPPGMPPAKTLRQVVSRLGLKGTVVGMLTRADVSHFALARACDRDLLAYAITTAGCGNLACVGEPGNYIERETQAICVGTINMIVVTNYRFVHEAMLEAIEVVTEAKVKAMYEFGLRSKANGESATGTGTDCVGVAVGSDRRYHLCGKHTKRGELIGRVSLESIRTAQVLSAGGILSSVLGLAGKPWTHSSPQDQATSGLEMIEAVRKDRVSVIDDRLIVHPRPRVVEGLEQISGLINRFATEPARAE